MGGDDATCLCQIGWEGSTCADKACAADCHENGGKCNEGECACPMGLIGLECEIKQDGCPDDCSGNGVCDEFTKLCHCHQGFEGANCAMRSCPGGCNEPNGQCYNGTCFCQPNYSGTTLAKPIAPTIATATESATSRSTRAAASLDGAATTAAC